MKIVFTIRNFYPSKGGGISYTFGLARALSKRGYDVSIVTSNKSLNIERENYCGINIYRIGYYELNGMEVLKPFHFYKLLKGLNPDIIHTNDPSPLGDLSFFMSRLFSVPLISTYHADLQTNKKLSRLYMLFKDKLMRKYDKIIVTTPMYRKILTARGIPDYKIKVIPVGINWKKFNAVPKSKVEALKEKLGVKDKKVILFVGGLSKGQRYKRLDLLIKVLKLLRRNDILLIVVGKGELLDYYKSLSIQLGIEDKVLFRDNVSDDELPVYYHIADVFVLPSPSNLEGFGIVLLEAMAAGCPVITSDKAGGSIVVNESGAGYVYRACDIYDLLNKIKKILDSKEIRHEKSKKAIKYSARFDWEKIASMIEKVYIEVLYD